MFEMIVEMRDGLRDVRSRLGRVETELRHLTSRIDGVVDIASRHHRSLERRVERIEGFLGFSRKR